MTPIRRAKLICTLGPACDSVEGLCELIDSGMDVARFNFSHGNHAEHGARLARLREACEIKKKPVAVLQDLCGPKIRTGTFKAPWTLESGAEITLEEGEGAGDETRIPIDYEGLARDVHIGDRIMFDDGRIVMQVSGITGDKVRVKITQGGGMRSRVGVHLPTRTLRISALTEKDKADLGFGLSQGVDYVALSFVRRAEDLRLVREICQEWGKPTPIIAKIETPDAIENLESVVAASDAVMVARGDLGVEFPPERVPVIQRQILMVARRVRRPVIVATEMLQSMTKSTRPTRAEASDVANAVFAGADCVMLSGETANGDYPTLAASMMTAITNEAEKSPFLETQPYASRATSVAEAVARGAVNTAREIGAKFLVAMTESGSSAQNVSLARPSVPIIAFSPNPQTRRRMALLWGRRPAGAPAVDRHRHRRRLGHRRFDGERPVLARRAHRRRLRRPARRERVDQFDPGARHRLASRDARSRSPDHRRARGGRRLRRRLLGRSTARRRSGGCWRQRHGCEHARRHDHGRVDMYERRRGAHESVRHGRRSDPPQDGWHLALLGRRANGGARLAGQRKRRTLQRNALGNIEQFAISPDAMFYRIGGMIFYRPKSQFTGNGACGGCDFGSNDTQLLGNGLAQTVVIADTNDVYLVDKPGGTKAYIAHAFSPSLAAVSPALSVVAGTAMGSTGVQVFAVPDAGPIDIQPLRLATNGDSIFYAKSNGDLVALEMATRKERVLATGQPSPIGEIVVTSTHLWFNTPAGVRRVRLSDACVQVVTDTATSSFAVAGTKVYVIEPGRVSVADVPN